jgi:hypothetical protein
MKSSDLEQASIWGQIFEITVKRGVIAYLLHSELLTENHPQLTHWKNTKISQLNKQLNQALKTLLPVQDTYIEQWIEAYFRHLLVLGYGLGWTTMRECLKYQPSRQMKLAAIWCPLSLPNQTDPRDVEREKTAQEFHQTWGISGFIDQTLLDQGQPARADFLLWLSPQENQKKITEDFILCFEFSYNAPLELIDFNLESSHCQEINRYARYLDSRGCFSRICAEVEGDQLQISSQLEKFLVAFSGKDKPLYKLCQASSYAEKLVNLLQKKGRLLNPCVARSMAITSNGVESLSAHFNSEINPQVRLMRSLGKAYQNMHKVDQTEDFEAETKLAFKKLLSSLPLALKQQAKSAFENVPGSADNFQINLTEVIGDFFQPNDEISQEEILNSIQETEALKQFFNGEPYQSIKQYLIQPQLTLRNAHQAVIEAGLNSAQKGRLNVIALEGNPGIGKTSSVVSYLRQQQEGFLFIYVSPRVVINRNVTQDLAVNEGKKTDILTLTTNAKLISSAPKWYEQNQVNLVNQKPRNIDSAVVINEVESIKLPETSILFVTPEQEREIDDQTINPNWYKKKLNEREQEANTKNSPGVLRTLATSARFLLRENYQINQIVLTAATQGYRNLQQKTTIEALDKLFQNAIDTRPGLKERQEFSQRIPTIIVMIDEVTGDGAGALFVHQIAKWLEAQFINPFREKPIFKVTLIVADASLSNEIVLSNFLDSGERVPGKILISSSRRNSPFQVTGSLVKIGSKKQPTLHVMTNSYPALSLQIDYSIRLAHITPEIDSDGQLENIRKAIRKQSGDLLLNNAWSEIKKGLENQAQQIIFFAQDKAFLRQLKELLTLGEKQLLLPQEVAVLDQSVSAYERLQLVTEPRRDTVKVFLMTSSGARGVSFPKADWIIASFPRFSVEASLMEIGQLIYRGRGRFTDPQTGKLCSGEEIPRRLVLLINDFLIESEKIDLKRQWLKQSTDLLTLLLMLRSTILTRIKGDSGLRKQQIAFVPVGSIGETELLRLISDEIQDFLREAQVFISDQANLENKQVVVKACQLINKLFADFDLIGRTSQGNSFTFTDYKTVEKLVKSISSPSSRLLPNLADSVIPDYLTCLGAFWWEDWGDRTVKEKYNFPISQPEFRQDHGQLIGCLSNIKQGKSFPSKLRRPASELYQLLKQEQKPEKREYSTLQEIKTNNLVIALPLDYPQFWKIPLDTEEVTKQQVLEDSVTWRNALGRTLTQGGIIIPVIPNYRSFPWVAVAGRQSLSQLEQVFDNRYFLASSELNLLNTILFEDDDLV